MIESKMSTNTRGSTVGTATSESCFEDLKTPETCLNLALLAAARKRFLTLLNYLLSKLDTNEGIRPPYQDGAKPTLPSLSLLGLDPCLQPPTIGPVWTGPKNLA